MKTNNSGVAVEPFVHFCLNSVKVIQASDLLYVSVGNNSQYSIFIWFYKITMHFQKLIIEKIIFLG